MSLVREVSIENYKSIRKLTFELGRINVLIGENGSGKSNVLEALVLASAESGGKLDPEYLVPRGIRVSDPEWMVAAFDVEALPSISIFVTKQGMPPYHCVVDSSLRLSLGSRAEALTELFFKWLDDHPEAKERLPDYAALPIKDKKGFRNLLDSFQDLRRVPDFVIYAPENSALRVFQAEGQVMPLGSRGDGLFAHLKRLSATHPDRLVEIGDRLALLDWFERLEIPKNLAPGERSILIRDRYLREGALFDQRSANEGFLFLLFYFTALISPDTPPFLGIDNVESSLNPKLAMRLVEQIVELATKFDKQIVLTTHSPAVLDGLDLSDDEQRLFVVERTKDGGTRARRVAAPKPLDGQDALPLSEAFVRGYLGGLPKNF